MTTTMMTLTMSALPANSTEQSFGDQKAQRNSPRQQLASEPPEPRTGILPKS